MINEHDRIVLTKRVPAEGLEQGDVGTVVHVYPDGKAFEVEFTTLDGKTAVVATVEAAAVRPVTANEITHSRGLTRAS
jgi:ATP-dependent exoDNAse (exonuclease V) alpha subunit